MRDDLQAGFGGLRGCDLLLQTYYALRAVHEGCGAGALGQRMVIEEGAFIPVAPVHIDRVRMLIETGVAILGDRSFPHWQ